MEVIIYTRQVCPLCEKGVAAASSIFGEANITLVDVDLDLDIMEKYTDRVPVIETVDGVVVDEGIIEESTLRSFSSRR
jgi:glutaredoxin